TDIPLSRIEFGGSVVIKFSHRLRSLREVDRDVRSPPQLRRVTAAVPSSLAMLGCGHIKLQGESVGLDDGDCTVALTRSCLNENISLVAIWSNVAESPPAT
ncbi:MAG: hypothetical protein PVH06_09020, partial [Methyloceanibacter sp.]